MDELKELFRHYDIKLNLDELQIFFDKLDADGTGTLDLQEFKDFQYNTEAKDGFRHLIKRMREKYTDVDGNFLSSGQLPYEFCIMLEYLSNKMTRDTIYSRIA